MLFGGFLDEAIHVNPANDVVKELGQYHFHGAASFALHGFQALPFWLAFSGFALASYIYMKNIALAGKIRKQMAPVVRILENKYGFDAFNQKFIAGGSVKLGEWLWKWSDSKLIDGMIVNGSAKVVNAVSKMFRSLQSGYVYHYALVMVVSVIVFISLYIF